MSINVRLGTAGWSIPKAVAASFPGEDSHLARYARVLGCAEINTTFTRTHRPATFERWAAETPPDFRLSAKLPEAMTHDARLKVPRAEVKAFTTSLAGLGDRLAALLVQLPPSLALDSRTARAFFRSVHAGFEGAVLCEPRHPSWFTPAAERLLIEERVGRVAADPARPAGAGEPGGWLGEKGDGRGATVYYRWHGSPRMYWSRYEDDWLAARAAEVSRWPAGTEVWCVFDNTAAGAAADDALRLQALLGRPT
ncbi:DUF72 domain-containing protein [Mitsuaria sp. 7]|uniref:DUF72 domain-containing protein n=1 Tax=Mitsuaria sp. 7 TaxID=1658665 RepID=UPI0007DE0336|nr:DUF72 domain-containing protein [Mitsuaria sp. 7]ANH67801.1 hypothetical protein ABE85_09830 [Mitsuaria sp. 7]